MAGADAEAGFENGQRMESFSLVHKGAGSPEFQKLRKKNLVNLGAFVVQSAANDIDEPEVPLHSPHQ